MNEYYPEEWMLNHLTEFFKKALRKNIQIRSDQIIRARNLFRVQNYNKTHDKSEVFVHHHLNQTFWCTDYWKERIWDHSRIIIDSNEIFQCLYAKLKVYETELTLLNSVLSPPARAKIETKEMWVREAGNGVSLHLFLLHEILFSFLDFDFHFLNRNFI